MIRGEQVSLLVAIDPGMHDSKMAGGEHPIDGWGQEFLSKSVESSFVILCPIPGPEDIHQQRIP